MDKVLKPERFDVNPNAHRAAKCWRHWLMTFENFVAAIPQEGLNKLQVLTNYVSSDVYDLYCESNTYDEAIGTLKSLYVKTPNEIFARHSLATRKQQSGETLDEYLQTLKTLSKDCNFCQVSAAQYRDEAVRDAFISGILSGGIRQRLLENKTLDLQTAFDQARALDTAQKTSESYNTNFISSAATTAHLLEEIRTTGEENTERTSAAATRTSRCFFCGNKSHPRSMCPAREAICNKCQKKGHYQRVCRSTVPTEPSTAALHFPTLATTRPTASKPLVKSCTDIIINGVITQALIDSGSTDSFIHPNLVEHHALKLRGPRACRFS